MATADEIRLVLARLQTMPSALKLAIGTPSGGQSLTKEDIIRHVEAEDEIGETIINAYMSYLRSFK